MIQKQLLNVYFFLADIIGINYLFRYINSKKIRALMYHGVTCDEYNFKYWLQLSAKKFRWQIDYINKKYTVITPLEFMEITKNRMLTKKNVVLITFDDGLLNNYNCAWPILKTLKIPAICFVLPKLSMENDIIWSNKLFEWFMFENYDHLQVNHNVNIDIQIPKAYNERVLLAHNIIGKLKNLDNKRRTSIITEIYKKYPITENNYTSSKLMNMEQIKELSTSNIMYISSHTDTHPVLSNLTTHEQYQEIKSSIDKLNDYEVKNLPLFAYPSGYYNDQTIKVLKDNNIFAAFTTNDGLHDIENNRYEINRISIGGNISRWEYKARLSGLYYFIKKINKKDEK